MQFDTKKTAAVFKALSDENRLKILQMLIGGEKCACKMLEEMNITQPTLSHHMKLLCGSGIVEGRKEGKWMYYSIGKVGLEAARQYIDMLDGTKSGNDCCCKQP